MGCRDLQKCEEAREKIIEASFNKNVHCKKLDLSSLKSIREFADDIIKSNWATFNFLTYFEYLF